MLAEIVDKFVQREYYNLQTEKSMSYNLFIPEGYDGRTKSSLLMLIADASTAGKDTKIPLTQGYGGVIGAIEKMGISVKDNFLYNSSWG